MSTNAIARNDGKEPVWEDVIALWVHGRPESTLYVYRPVIAHFRNFAQCSLQDVELKHLQAFEDLFGHQKPNTRKRKIAAVESLLGFAHRIGAIRFNPATALRSPHVEEQLAEKILTRKDTLRMIELEMDEQNRVVLTLLYTAGIRASEECQLRWIDCRPRGSSDGFISVFGQRPEKAHHPARARSVAGIDGAATRQCGSR